MKTCFVAAQISRDKILDHTHEFEITGRIGTKHVTELYKETFTCIVVETESHVHYTQPKFGSYQI